MQKVRKNKKQDMGLTIICKHISRLMGNDGRSSLIISEIQKWYKLSGPQWTLDRLKLLKRGVLEFLTIEHYKQKGIFPMVANSYIKHDGRGWPKGPLGCFIKSSLLSKHNQDFKLGKLLSVLEVYRSFKLKELSSEQKRKFLEAIQGLPHRKDLFEHSYNLGIECSKTFPNIYKRKFKYWYRSNHRFSFAGLNSAKPLTSFISKEIKEQEHPWLLSLIEGTTITGPWTSIIRDMGLPVVKNAPPAIFAGVVNILQEGGHKARVIAMPTASIQVAFKPLHDTIGKILQQLPEDCTYDQNKGITWGAAQLRAGHKVHAVDLSSATDNFPLGFQKAVLESLNYEYVDEFIQTCKLKWGCTEKSVGTLVYTKGQPMGLYGSFALFALSHHYVLKKIEETFNVSNTYRILGDDIIIANDEVHTKYMRFMKHLGVPISISKCLDSDLYTEFAGKIISVEGRIPVAKGPKNYDKSGLIDVNTFLNYSEVSKTTKFSVSAVPKKYRPFAENLASLPQSFGGLGFNPKGLPLIERLVRFEESKQTAYPFLTDLSRSVKRLPFKATSDHVADVCLFVNEQLTGVHNKISAELLKLGFNPRPFDNSLNRSLLNQVLRKDDMMLSYSGTITDIVSKVSTIKSWYNASNSQMRKIEKIFDSDVNFVNTHRSEEDIVTNKVMNPIKKAVSSIPTYPTFGM